MKQVNQKHSTMIPGHNPPLVREHVFKKMDEILTASHLFITAPAGSGKTMLVETFLASRPAPAARLSIPPTGFDEKIFMELLQKELDKMNSTASAQKANQPQRNASETQNSVSLSEKDHNSFIVIDNYERIEDSSPIHTTINTEIEKRNNKYFKFILISRKKLPNIYIRNQSNFSLQSIVYRDIKYSKNEILKIFTSITGLNNDIDISKFNSLFDGWIAGYILVAQSYLREGFDLQKINPINLECIHQYFEYQVFSKIPREIQSFLLKICIPAKIDSKMACSLSGEEKSKDYLQFLHENNYFLSSLYGPKKEYILQPYFKSFLLYRLKNQSTDNEFIQTLRNTSALLQYSGNKDEALTTLIEQEDWTGAVQILEVNSENIINSKGKKSYLKLAADLPKKIRHKSNWLRYWEAECLREENFQKSIDILEEILYSFAKEKDISGMYLSWAQLVDRYIDLHAGTNPLKKLLQTFKKVSSDYPEYPTEEVKRNCISGLMSIYCILYPQSGDIEKNSPTSFFPFSSKIQEKYSFIYGIYLIMMGKFERTNIYINSLQEKNLENFSQTQCIPQILRSLLNTKKGFYDLKTNEKPFSNFFMGKYFDFWNELLKIDMLLFLKNIEEANNSIEMINSRIGNNVFSRYFYYILKTKISLHQQNFEQSELYLDICKEISQDLEIPFVNFELEILNSYLEHMQGNIEKSTQSLSKAHKIASSTKSKLLLYQEEALRYYLTKNDKHLDKINLLGKKFGYSDTIINTNEYLLEITTTSLQKGKSPEHIHDIIKKHDIKPNGPALEFENWPWPLQIFTLGRFSVVINGKTIKFSRRAQQKPLSMLKVIIALGGRKIREDLISDALWPDADGDIAHQSFATTLHRLRKLIGHHETIEVQNKLVSLNSKMCWVDSWVFERLCGEADDIWNRGPKFKHEASLVAQQAISLYHGSFLGSESWRPWILPLREKLQSKFIRSIKNIALYYQNQNKWPEAINFYLKGLEVDNLSEDLYRGLMKSYHNTGLCSEALSTYNRCKNSLKSELEVDPSPKTTAIWKDIRNNSSLKSH